MNDQTSIRPEVTRLARWGPLPPEDEWTDADLMDFTNELLAVTTPLSEPERDLLVPLLDREAGDTLAGMVLTVIYLLESTTSQDDAWVADLSTENRPWHEYLHDRWGIP